MGQIKNKIKIQINNGLSIIERMNRITNNSSAGPNTRELIKVVEELYPLIKDDYPIISLTLEKGSRRLIHNGMINPFFFGDIRTSLNILNSIYNRPPKIFISHKSEDKPFVDALVGLLRLYIGSESEKIFCSSIPNYRINVGKEIYNEIKSQFEKYDIYMIIIHSPRYYKSSICLNEMGASWILNTECSSFLTADCGFENLNGVVDNQHISIKVNHDDAKDLMNDFLRTVLDFFNLHHLDITSFSQWESDRDNFLKAVCG